MEIFKNKHRGLERDNIFFILLYSSSFGVTKKKLFCAKCRLCFQVEKQIFMQWFCLCFCLMLRVQRQVQRFKVASKEIFGLKFWLPRVLSIANDLVRVNKIQNYFAILGEPVM